MRSLYCIVATSLLATGCGQSPKELLDENRPQLEARVRAIEQFAKKVESGEASTAKLTFPNGEKLRFVSGTDEGNTMRMHTECALGKTPTFEFEYGEGSYLRDAKRAVAGEYLWEESSYAQVALRKVLQPRYMLLVKVDKVTLPEINEADKTFVTGSVEFRVYGFDLIESKELGVAYCKTENSDKVSVRDKYKTNDNVKTDLATNASLEFMKALP